MDKSDIPGFMRRRSQSSPMIHRSSASGDVIELSSDDDEPTRIGPTNPIKMEPRVNAPNSTFRNQVQFKMKTQPHKTTRGTNQKRTSAPSRAIEFDFGEPSEAQDIDLKNGHTGKVMFTTNRASSNHQAASRPLNVSTYKIESAVQAEQSEESHAEPMDLFISPDFASAESTTVMDHSQIVNAPSSSAFNNSTHYIPEFNGSTAEQLNGSNSKHENYNETNANNSFNGSAFNGSPSYRPADSCPWNHIINVEEALNEMPDAELVRLPKFRKLIDLEVNRILYLYLYLGLEK